MSNALICGAGVGGLSAGVSLEQAGVEVCVYERFPEPRTAGVGINIWPNGVRAIFGMGLRDRYASIAATVTRYRSITDEGVEVNDIDVSDWCDRFGAPLTGVHRKDLNGMLADHLGPDRVKFGYRLERYRDEGDSVTCEFANGETASGAFLVGADGVHSTVRMQVLGGPVTFRSDNLVRWRGVFALEDAGVPPTVQYDAIGRKGHLGWIPIGKGLAYWFATGEGLLDFDAFRAYFSSWHKTPVPAVLEATPDETVINNELVEFETHLQAWGKGRVTLLGDAAHPMLPGLAQGANQALDDAATLGQCLRESSDVESALRRYEAARAPIAHRVVELSRRLFDFEESYAASEPGAPNPIISRFESVAALEGAPR